MSRWKAPPLASLEIIEMIDRGRLVRHSAYRQLDGSFISSAECECDRDPFTCPIDRHAIDARQLEIRGAA